MKYRGSIMLLALVFGAIFFTVFTALSGYVLSGNNFEIQKRAQSEAVAIAEAGLEYYRWHLAHFPNDLQDGTGHPGPYTITYKDPTGGDVGTYTLNINGNKSCGQITSIDIDSTGVPADDTNVSETLVARYARPTVARYSYVINGSVWAGPDRIINGPYHSNGGVRMDGTANAPVTSSLSSWTCTSSFGCTPNKTEPGVFGSGNNQNLWKYPTPQVDFKAIESNFSSLKTIAKKQGLYFSRYSSGTGGWSWWWGGNSSSYYRGYYLIFNGDGTVTVKKVTRVATLESTPVDGSNSYGWNDHTLILGETTLGTYTIPSNCGLIYVEDNVWVEGTVSRKITLVSANVSDIGVTTKAVLEGNITYKSPNAGLTLIEQGDVLVAPNSPNNMTLDGIFIAQNGAFGRNYYSCSKYPSYSQKGTLTMLGSVISNKRTGTQWTGTPACGKTYSSGYAKRINSFDRSLFTNPPPFTPAVSSDYQFVSWRQK